MRITFVTMQFGRGYTQGTERYVGTLAESMRRRGHEVTCLAGDPLNRRGRRSLGDVIEPDLHAHPTCGWMAVEGISPQKLADWLQAHQPDLVHVANPAHIGTAAMVACRRLGIPVVVTTMDFWWVCPKATLLRPGGQTCNGHPRWHECVRCHVADHARPAARVLGHGPPPSSVLTFSLYAARSLARGLPLDDLLRWTNRRRYLADRLGQADAIIFPSSATREAIVGQLGHDRWHVIPYGLPGEWFADARPRPEAARPPDALTIGYAGAILPHKAPHLLLEAVRRLGWSRTRVRFAGPSDDPAYRAKMQRAAAGLNVEFAGRLDAAAMPAFLRSLDALAMTSIWPENLPFIVLEAHAAGIPVVASHIAGVAEQVGDERLLFEPGDGAGLARALRFVGEHPHLCRPGGVSTIDETTDATLEVYARVLNRPGRARMAKYTG